MELSFTHFIVNTVNTNNILDFISSISSLGMAIFAIVQCEIAKSNRNIDLFKARIGHYQKLQDIIEDFYILVPIGQDNNGFYLKKEKIEKSQANLDKIMQLRMKLNLLVTESKYLFKNKDVHKFEQDFYEIIRNLKHIFDKDEPYIFSKIEKDTPAFVERIRRRDELFDNDLNIDVSIMKFFK